MVSPQSMIPLTPPERVSTRTCSAHRSLWTRLPHRKSKEHRFRGSDARDPDSHSNQPAYLADRGIYPASAQPGRALPARPLPLLCQRDKCAVFREILLAVAQPYADQPPSTHHRIYRAVSCIHQMSDLSLHAIHGSTHSQELVVTPTPQDQEETCVPCSIWRRRLPALGSETTTSHQPQRPGNPTLHPAAPHADRETPERRQ